MVMIDGVTSDRVLETLLLAELTENEQSVFNHVAALDCGCSLLAFLDANANTLSTSDALAFRLGEENESVELALEGLHQIGLVRRLDVGPTLWGLAIDPEHRDITRTLVAWQNRWRVRLAKLDRVIHGVVCDGKKRRLDDIAHDCANHPDCSRCASYLLAAISGLQDVKC